MGLDFEDDENEIKVESIRNSYSRMDSMAISSKQIVDTDGQEERDDEMRFSLNLFSIVDQTDGRQNGGFSKENSYKPMTVINTNNTFL